MELARKLADELQELGLTEVTVDEHAYVMATLAANTDKEVPAIGFLAHLDTATDFTGANVKPQIIENYDGGDIVLNREQNIILSTASFPELPEYKGHTLITTDGTTLLGADNKAGIAEIMTAMAYLITHPEIKHGKIRVAFTPDEEIGRGPHKFDVAAFGASYAYTVDGGRSASWSTRVSMPLPPKSPLKASTSIPEPPRVKWSTPPKSQWPSISDCLPANRLNLQTVMRASIT